MKLFKIRRVGIKITKNTLSEISAKSIHQIVDATVPFSQYKLTVRLTVDSRLVPSVMNLPTYTACFHCRSVLFYFILRIRERNRYLRFICTNLLPRNYCTKPSLYSITLIRCLRSLCWKCQDLMYHLCKNFYLGIHQITPYLNALTARDM